MLIAKHSYKLYDTAFLEIQNMAGYEQTRVRPRKFVE